MYDDDTSIKMDASTVPIKICRGSNMFMRLYRFTLGPVIIYRLGGGGDFGGIIGFLDDRRGGSVITENPKGGIIKVVFYWDQPFQPRAV